MRLSPSYAETVEQCPLRARWLRIDKVEQQQPEGDHGLRAGRCIHQALEGTYAALRARSYIGPLHTPGWLKIARDNLDAAIVEHGPFPDPTIIDLRGQMLDYLLDQHDVSSGDIIGLEQFITWPLRKGTNVVGFADRIERRAEQTVAVVDYKGGYRRWHPDLIRASLQTQTYAVAVAKENPWAQRIVVEIHMLHHREVASAMWTADDLANVEAQLRERYLEDDDLMRDGPWEPRTGPWCSRCEFKAVCPAWNGTPPAGAWDPQLGRKRTANDGNPSLLDTEAER